VHDNTEYFIRDVNHAKTIMVSSGFKGKFFVQREPFFDWVIRVKLKFREIGEETIDSQVCEVDRAVLRGNSCVRGGSVLDQVNSIGILTKKLEKELRKITSPRISMTKNRIPPTMIISCSTSPPLEYCDSIISCSGMSTILP